MKRYLNELRSFNVKLVSGKSYRYELDADQNPDLNEVFIGLTGSVVKGLFIKKASQIYSLSHDDFSLDFLNEENARLNAAFTVLVESIPAGLIPDMPDEDGVA